MSKANMVYIALLICCAGTAFKVSTWFRYSLRVKEVHSLRESFRCSEGYFTDLVQPEISDYSEGLFC